MSHPALNIESWKDFEIDEATVISINNRVLYQRLDINANQFSTSSVFITF